MSRIQPKHRLAALAVAISALSLPAHAQFGSLFQAVMQSQQKAEQAKAAEAAAAPPAKRWSAAQSVPVELKQQAEALSARIPDAQMRPLYERLYIEGERNATLNYERIGLAALAAGRLDEAEKAFEAATFRIDQIYADNAEAQKAKSLWTAEKIKDYKGEPYERAMAYYYRGLVYVARGDFQNARAMFKQADYQDTVAESEQYAGDFGLMPYMAGWASHCDGNANLAQDFLQMAVKGDASYASMRVDQPVLVLFETGRAPFKYGAGKHGEALKWQPHEGSPQAVKSICAAGGGECLPGSPVQGADLGFQATTRGGRPIDAVLDGKAAFKDGAQSTANVAGAVGAAAMDIGLASGNNNAAGLGLLGLFAGLVAQGVAASTQTQADIREWEQLPATVWLGTAADKTEAGLAAMVETEGGSAQPVTLTRLADTPSCQLYWGRSNAPLGTVADAGPIEPGKHARDPAFRQALEQAVVTQASN
ncbi:hypothetical protein [Ottowia thiooxydans]|uniref:hypothetical protein n=1 Tax=Ottowia thiooxydans TaxID=219182 RepID=UPI0004094CA6|nr:hypothetical protein [Ottowia thiooxydans]